MLQKQVLVEGLSNLNEARYCAGMGVQYLCFDLDTSHPEFVGFDKIAEIRNWISGSKVGGRIKNWSVEIPWETLSLDFLIVDTVEYLEKAEKLGLETFFECGTNAFETSHASHLLVAQQDFEVSMAQKHSSIFLFGNQNPASAPAALSYDFAWAVNVQSAARDTDKLEYLIEILEALEEN